MEFSSKGSLNHIRTIMYDSGLVKLNTYCLQKIFFSFVSRIMATSTATGKSSEIGKCNSKSNESCGAAGVLHFASLSQPGNKATSGNAPAIIEEQFQEMIPDNGTFYSALPLQRHIRSSLLELSFLHWLNSIFPSSDRRRKVNWLEEYQRLLWCWTRWWLWLACCPRIIFWLLHFIWNRDKLVRL